MNILRVIAAVIGAAAFIAGIAMALPDERAAGRALIIGGAIIIAGVLIATAINGNRK